MTFKTLTLKLETVDNSIDGESPLRKIVLTTRANFNRYELRDALSVLGINPNLLSDAITMHVDVGTDDIRYLVDESLKKVQDAANAAGACSVADMATVFAQGKRAGYTRGYFAAHFGNPSDPEWYDMREHAEVLREQTEAAAPTVDTDWNQAQRWVPPTLETRVLYDKQCPYNFGGEPVNVAAQPTVAKPYIGESAPLPPAEEGMKEFVSSTREQYEADIAHAERRGYEKAQEEFAGQQLYTKAELDAAVTAASIGNGVHAAPSAVRPSNVWDARGNSWGYAIGDFRFSPAEETPKYGEYVTVEGFPECIVPMPNPEIGYTRHALFIDKDAADKPEDAMYYALSDVRNDDGSISGDVVPVIVTVLR